MWVYPKLDEIFGLCLLHFIILGDVKIQKLNCKGFPRAICRTWHVQFHHFQCLDFFCLQRIIFSSQLEWSLWAWLQEWCLIGVCFTRLCMGCCIGMLLDLRDSTISNQAAPNKTTLLSYQFVYRHIPLKEKTWFCNFFLLTFVVFWKKIK